VLGIHEGTLVTVSASIDRLPHRSLDEVQQALKAVVEEGREVVLAHGNRIDLVGAKNRVELGSVDFRLGLDRGEVLARCVTADPPVGVGVDRRLVDDTVGVAVLDLVRGAPVLRKDVVYVDRVIDVRVNVDR